MADHMPTIESLQQEIDKLRGELASVQARNRRVEAEKAWETSWARRSVIFLLTYFVIVMFFAFAKLPDPFANALVPAVAFVLSQISVSVLKKWWLKNRKI